MTHRALNDFHVHELKVRFAIGVQQQAILKSAARAVYFVIQHFDGSRLTCGLESIERVTINRRCFENDCNVGVTTLKVAAAETERNGCVIWILPHVAYVCIMNVVPRQAGDGRWQI